MNILFLHRNFPAQFRHILPVLASDKNNKVVFITNNDKMNMDNVLKVVYKLKREVPDNCHRYLRTHEESVIHGQSAAEAAIYLKEQGFTPDVIYAHSWGQAMFIKDVFPDSPLLCYFEWFYDKNTGDVGFDGKPLNIDDYAKLRAKNAPLLIDLYSADAGICPTEFQKKQFPKEFDSKIKVMHDGVNVDFCVPDENASFSVEDKNLTLTRKDEVITYATRGMEAYRGFPEFMRAVEKLLKKRPNLHVIIGGEDRVCYGPQLANTTYKKLMLQELDLDMNRVHFVGPLPYYKYVNLLQISSAHIYLTYPFVASWSLLEAMSCGCPVVASSTEPVLEFIKDGENGILFDFYDIDEQVRKIEFALDNKALIQPLRENARKTIVDNYNINDLLPKHVEYLKSLAKK